LNELVEATHLTAAVGVLRRGRVLLLENVDSPEPLRVNLTVGSEVPFDTCALGRVLVAWFPRRQIAALIEEYGLSKSASRSPVTKSKLLQQLEVVRGEGYAIHETTGGARAVAVPILDGQNRVCAALVGAGATALQVWERFDDLVKRMKAAAGAIAELTRTVDWQQLYQ
jgi:DNA-binding IclR family transcriptional regulator